MKLVRFLDVPYPLYFFSGPSDEQVKLFIQMVEDVNSLSTYTSRLANQSVKVLKSLSLFFPISKRRHQR